MNSVGPASERSDNPDNPDKRDSRSAEGASAPRSGSCILTSRRFRGIVPGIESLPANFHLPRHTHLRSYATVVLAGCFEEAGFVGRIRASAGDVLVHPTLDCHANRMISPGVKLLRLDWADAEEAGGLYRLDDLDSLVRTAEKDVCDAALLLKEALADGQASPAAEMNDWPDLLAATLVKDRSIGLGDWAEANGLARETVSRGFASVYGIPPTAFRGELRARAAWLRVTRGSDYLSAIAAETGFADQSHMTRWIHRLTGAPPALWRKRPN